MSVVPLLSRQYPSSRSSDASVAPRRGEEALPSPQRAVAGHFAQPKPMARRENSYASHTASTARCAKAPWVSGAPSTTRWTRYAPRRVTISCRAYCPCADLRTEGEPSKEQSPRPSHARRDALMRTASSVGSPSASRTVKVSSVVAYSVAGRGSGCPPSSVVAPGTAGALTITRVAIPASCATVRCMSLIVGSCTAVCTVASWCPAARPLALTRTPMSTAVVTLPSRGGTTTPDALSTDSHGAGAASSTCHG
mmetsp:Transcript_33974/g.84678  ORF Transcript_33974/g.84678 Transcript_33974/m.84678 type:complete len:252 (-) Transcript_33974:1872-2627(-)